MKNKTLEELIENYPNEIAFDEIVDFENFDERLSVVDCIVVNSIGVNEGFIEFIPDNNPPLNEEILCWIWAIRPDLTYEILQLNISDDFKFALNSYLNNSMDKFWDYINEKIMEEDINNLEKENLIKYIGILKKNKIAYDKCELLFYNKSK